MKRRLWTLTLGLANAAALAGLLWVLESPGQPDWLPAGASAPAPAPSPVVLRGELDPARRALTWTQPVFSPTRQPDPAREVVTANPLSNLTLAGTFQEGPARWVYLSEPGQPVIKLDQGEALDNGWTLDQLTSSSATFIRQGQTQTLSLPMRRLPPPTPAPTLTLPRTPTP